MQSSVTVQLQEKLIVLQQHSAPPLLISTAEIQAHGDVQNQSFCLTKFMNSTFCASVPASHKTPAFSHPELPSFACLHYREGNFPQKSQAFLLDNSNIHYVELRNKAPRGKNWDEFPALCILHPCRDSQCHLDMDTSSGSLFSS